MIKYTFIIPHKNLPAYLLRRCLDSIPHWEDLIQIIVVDDASDPQTVNLEQIPGVGELCTEVYFTKEGKGPGFARNFGLEKAKGEWVFFADADDYYNKENLEKLLSIIANREDLEAVGFKMKTINLDKSCFIGLDGYKYSCELALSNERGFFYMAKGPVQKVLRKSFIEKYHLQFDEFIGSEDLMFSLKVASLLKNYALFDDVIYVYEKRSSSLETSLAKRIQCTKMNASIRATKYLKHLGMLEYRDPAAFYLWRLKHSQPLMFAWFLIKEFFVLGPKMAYADYKEVAKSDNVSANPFVFILNKIRKR